MPWEPDPWDVHKDNPQPNLNRMFQVFVEFWLN